MNLDGEIGSFLRETRIRKRLTQPALAARAGTTQSAISRIESGREAPSFERVRTLLICMGERLVWDTEPLPNPAVPASPDRTRPRGERLIDGHRTVERQSLAFHELIVERLSEQTVARAERTLDRYEARGGFDPELTRRWRELLARPIAEVRAGMLADTDEGRELRQMSPFRGVISQTERERILSTVR